MASAVSKDGKGKKAATGIRDALRSQSRSSRTRSERREGKDGVNSDDDVQPHATKESDTFDERASLCSASPLLSESHGEDAEGRRGDDHDELTDSDPER